MSKLPLFFLLFFIKNNRRTFASPPACAFCLFLLIEQIMELFAGAGFIADFLIACLAQVQPPRARRAKGGGVADAQVERGAHQSSRRAGEMGDQYPLDKAADGLHDFLCLSLHRDHGQSLQLQQDLFRHNAQYSTCRKKIPD